LEISYLIIHSQNSCTTHRKIIKVISIVIMSQNSFYVASRIYLRLTRELIGEFGGMNRRWWKKFLWTSIVGAVFRIARVSTVIKLGSCCAKSIGNFSRRQGRSRFTWGRGRERTPFPTRRSDPFNSVSDSIIPATLDRLEALSII